MKNWSPTRTNSEAKWKTRLAIFVLLAGLICSTACNEKAAVTAPPLVFRDSVTLAWFPSASAIETDGRFLYIVGDDANIILKLDTAFRVVDTTNFTGFTAYRQSKKEKFDLESAAEKDGVIYLFGSASTLERKKNFLIRDTSLSIAPSGFELLLPNRIDEFNVEGATFVKDSLWISQRANRSQPMNYLMVSAFDTTSGYLVFSEPLPIKIGTGTVAGISGLYYMEKEDILLFTASEENTLNAIDDGAINDSYLGLIRFFSKKTKAGVFKPDGLYNLTTAFPFMRQQKIESVCTIRNGNDHLIFLVADNDDGSSRIFRMTMRF